MGKICDFFIKKSNKSILMISSIIFVLFMIIVLPKVSAYMEDVTGTNVSPDTNLIYSSDDLFDIANSYGETGRDAYVFLRFTFDIIWPIVYFIFLVSLTSVLIKKLNLKEKYKNLLLIPIFGVVFDFLENISSVVVMYNYPVEMMFFANIAPFMTLLKWVFMGLSFTSIIVLILISLVKRR